jgi:hypothetical protein
MFHGHIKINQSNLQINGSTPSYTVRAWAYGAGSSDGATLLGGNNISSVSRTAKGVYKVNFYFAMPSANYAVSVCCSASGAAKEIVSAYTQTADSFVFDCVAADGTFVDPTAFRIMVSC